MRKLETALKVRQTPLCIVARTDAMEVKEGIERAKAFHAAGADILLIDGLKSLDDMKRVADEVPGHKQVNLIYGGLTPMLPAQELYQLGFKIIQYSTPALYISARAMQQQLSLLRQTQDLNSISPHSMTFSEFQNFISENYANRFTKSSNSMHLGNDLRVRTPTGNSLHSGRRLFSRSIPPTCNLSSGSAVGRMFSAPASQWVPFLS